MDKEIIKKVKKFSDLVIKHFPVKMILIYGSFASGLNHENSDIDVAVIVNEIKGDYLKLSSKLFSFVWDIDTRIEPVLLEFKKDQSGFLESILKNGKVIYNS